MNFNLFRRRALGLVCALSLLISGFALSGCSEDEDDSASLVAAIQQGTSSAAAVSSAGFYERSVRDPQVQLRGNGQDTVTVLVYMNGSNLESDDGSATEDLKEMVRAGSAANVNVLVETLGTKTWQSTFGISSKRSQIYEVSGSGLTLVKDDLGQRDCTDPDTLRDFIIWGAQRYPADRYILILWDHGGGPVYGFGYDEYQAEDAALTIDEMQSALRSAGVYFDFIGFDACIMSCLELCCAMYDYCDYMILSEDFEPGIGWYYTDWLKALYANTSISTEALGRTIVDTMIHANETDRNGDEATLSLIDQSVMKVLYSAWENFAYANESTLLKNNYSRRVRSVGRTLPRLKGSFDLISDWLSDDDEDYSLADYYITDLMAIASSVNSEESNALSSAISQAVVYTNSTSGRTNLSGIAVTLPYGDSNFYNSLSSIFSNCGFSNEYIRWLGKFVSSSGSSDFYNYDDWDESWDGWDDYEDDYDWGLWDLLFGWDLEDEDYDDYYSYGWDDWDYDDSWNEWLDENDDDMSWWDILFGDDDWDYEDDWDDDYWDDDDWDDDEYGSFGSWLEDVWYYFSY